MLQQRPFIARCILSCLIALGGLFAVSRLSIAAISPMETAAASDRSTAITPTDSIDLLPDTGYFADTPVNLPGVQNGSASWGDCNNDGLSDVLLTGQISTSLKIARVYRQSILAGFTLDAVLTGVMNSAAAWGDYDNDGWLDIALTGESDSGLIAQVYHNAQNSVACTFSAVAVSLGGVRNSAVAWSDYNADGQIDLLLAGDNGSQLVTKIYRNDHGSFSDSGLILPGIQNGAAAWSDYDNDGLADLLLTGSAAVDAPLTKLYHNNGLGALIEVSITLPALRDSAAAWGDYNNDGDLDLLLEGTTEDSMSVAKIYDNNHGTFAINPNAILTGSLHWVNAAWGDYDTDGYVDALISTNDIATAYHNESAGSFASGIGVGSSALDAATAAWGHYDGDRNLDVLLTGQSLGGRVTKVYKYSNFLLNDPPNPPSYLTSTVTGSSVVLKWSPAVFDDHTALAGLSYNLRVGTRPGGIDIIAPMALVTTNLAIDGYRLLPAVGSAYQARAITLSHLPVGKTYYWSVQAIDTSFLGSNFAAEGSFMIPYRVYLPLVLKDAITYYTNEWETEPNNTYLQSNGPLKSGQIYRGRHNDEKDYYSVRLPISGTLNVDMASPNGGTQIQLFYQIADVAHRVGADATPPYHIDYMGESGWYYVYVYTNPAFVGSQTYTLTVTYQ